MSFTPETLLRHWQTLRLIPRAPRRIAVSDLRERLTAEGFTVGRRTVERDLNALSGIFPIVSDDRSKPYGWSWQADAPAFDLPGMSNSEALTLLMGREHIQSVLPSSTVAQMLPHFRMAEKKLAALKGHKGIAAWPDKVRVVPPTQPLHAPRIAPEIQTTIHDALLSDCQCRVRYQGRSSAKTETYTLHPLALVQRGQVLYLVCTIKTYSDIRLLAVHRIRDADLIDTPAKPPKGFDLDAYLASGAFSWIPGELIHLDAAFTQEAGAHLTETPLADDQRIKTMADGRMRVQATVRETQQLVWWMLGFGEGGTLEPTMTLPFDGKKLVELFELIVRGLTYWHWGTYLNPKTCYVRAAFLTSAVQNIFARLLALNAKDRVNGSLGNGAFVYEGALSAECPELTVWRMSLYGAQVAGDPKLQKEKCSEAYALTAPRNWRSASEIVRMLDQAH